MPASRSTLVACAVLVFAGVVGCSSSSTPRLLASPPVEHPDAGAFAGVIPAGLPSTCPAGDYAPDPSGTDCAAGEPEYVLCDGTAWNQFTCTDPAQYGWVLYANPSVVAPCTSDAQCAAGSFCEVSTGDCVAGAPTTTACTADADCSAFDFCDTSSGFCTSNAADVSCTTDAQCGGVNPYQVTHRDSA